LLGNVKDNGIAVFSDSDLGEWASDAVTEARETSALVE